MNWGNLATNPEMSDFDVQCLRSGSLEAESMTKTLGEAIFVQSVFRRREGKQSRADGKTEQECGFNWRLTGFSHSMGNINSITELVSL